MSPLYLISPLILQSIIWPGTRFCLWFFGGLKVTGLENLAPFTAKKSGTKAREHGVIFAPNHRSDLDPILIPACLPFLSKLMPIFYTSREKSFYDQVGPLQRLLYGGFFFKLWGSHAVKVGLKDYEKSLATHIVFLKKGKSVLVFPEGGIDRSGGVFPAKGGVTYLSHQYRAPIIPVAISGVFRITLKELLLRRRRITVQFLPPIYPEDIVLQKILTGETNYVPAAQAIMDKIYAAVRETSSLD